MTGLLGYGLLRAQARRRVIIIRLPLRLGGAGRGWLTVLGIFVPGWVVGGGVASSRDR
jgi:hypothetical protein